MKRIVCTAAVLFTLAGPALAGFNEGLAALSRNDYATALREWRPLAEQGDAAAQYKLGDMYRYGWGVELDFAEAVRWYRKAAEQGHAESQYEFGLFLSVGLGVRQDTVEAYKWLSLAVSRSPVGVFRDEAIKSRTSVANKYLTSTQQSEAERRARDWRPRTRVASGSRNAELGKKTRQATTPSSDASPAGTTRSKSDLAATGQARTGFENGLAAYERGDYAAALREFRPLAEQGDAESQFGLGIMYFAGWGVVRNDRESVRWLRRAAEQGYPHAQKYLGQMYRDGHGVSRDRFQAYKWLYLAASRLSVGEQRDKAIKARDDLAKHLMPTERFEAEQLARNWHPRKELASRSRVAGPGTAPRPAKTPSPAASTAGTTRSKSDLAAAVTD